MITKDKLPEYISWLKAEKESDVPINRREERAELLRAVEMLDEMYKRHLAKDTEAEANPRFETTGKQRNYVQEREALMKFTILLEERLEQYFSRRELIISDEVIEQLDMAIELLYVSKHEIKQGKEPNIGNLILASSIINQLRDSFLTEENTENSG